MSHPLAAVVLAAGAGTRLLPLTRLRPKALCPVGTRPLVDLALDRVATVVADQRATAVNLHHGGDQLDAHLPAAVHRSRERPEALGTAGALGALRPWIDGRPVLVTNADAWLASATPGHGGAVGADPVDLSAFVSEWDGERVRLLCVETGRPADFDTLRYCGVALLPAAMAGGLTAEPAGLYEVLWRAEAEADRLDLVVHRGRFVDCGTPASYLAANLAGSGGAAVVDPSAAIGNRAKLERTVVWDRSEVAPGEHLVDAIRAERLTVLVR